MSTPPTSTASRNISKTSPFSSTQFSLFDVPVSHIRKMRLSCGQSELDNFAELSVDTWICIAAGPHLQELHLALFSSDYPGFRLPLCILSSSCTNLHSIR
ncbi:F-box/RNI/FBD-like domain protein [Trifolium medium]|uniref:F-box/RNI/FBD-like domain protein n=1 Tax=Trifolium medium TaxID=97028 RepID=A0A392QWW9_9FABA|nr:F-box/RNI/FBD-like domain protein [Trifolium medium]